MGDASTLINAVHAIGEWLLHSRPEDEAGQHVIDLMEHHLGYGYGALMVVHPQTGDLVPLSLSRQGQSDKFVSQDRAHIRRHGMRLGRGITGWVAATGRTERIGDVTRDTRYVSVRDGIRSELCVPLRYDDTVLGVLNTESAELHAFSELDARVLETIAGQLALYLVGARLRSRLGELAELQALLDEHGSATLEACGVCRRVRLPGQAEWVSLQRWLADHLGIQLTHGICDACFPTHFGRSLDDSRRS